jgi:metallo-beta-lactamase class B
MISEVRPGVFWVHPPAGGEMYVVKTTAGLVLVDSGFFEHRELILDDLRQAGLDPREIALAFITHAHCDHIGGMGWWQQEFGVPVVAHMHAADPIEQADRIVTAAELPFANISSALLPCPVAHRVQGGETFTVGERSFEVIYAPGHTIGSIHILSGQELFVGDTVYANGGIGWVDIHWGSNPEDYVETLERMRKFLGKLALAGHGEPYELLMHHIEQAKSFASFYILPAHGFGMPRVPSAY